MSERDNRTPGHPEGLPPEVYNTEQDAKGEQAQDVAEAAQLEESHTSSPTESTKPEPGGYDPAPGSEADLIDEMRRMEGEGRIDMSAFAGEPNHDDEPETFGSETTDDETAWLTANGEELAEEKEQDLLDGDSLFDDEEE
jgi:hypothetical protein